MLNFFSRNCSAFFIGLNEEGCPKKGSLFLHHRKAYLRYRYLSGINTAGNVAAIFRNGADVGFHQLTTEGYQVQFVGKIAAAGAARSVHTLVQLRAISSQHQLVLLFGNTGAAVVSPVKSNPGPCSRSGNGCQYIRQIATADQHFSIENAVVWISAADGILQNERHCTVYRCLLYSIIAVANGQQTIHTLCKTGGKASIPWLEYSGVIIA